MKYLKFYISTEVVENLANDKDNINDIRFVESQVSLDGKEIELTCLVESKDGIGEDNPRDCYRYKLI